MVLFNTVHIMTKKYNNEKMGYGQILNLLPITLFISLQ